MSLVAGGQGCRSWPSTFFLLLTCLPFLLADDTEQYVSGGGILLVLGIDVALLIVIMILYYSLVATDSVTLRKSDEDQRETEGLLLQEVAPSSQRELGLTTAPFPTDWRRKSNAFSRFFAYWGCWWNYVIRTSQESVIENAGFDAAAYLRIQITMIIMFAALSFFCLVVLLPVYATSDLDTKNPLSIFSQITAENISSGDSRVWAVLIGDLLVMVGVFATFGFGVSLFRERVGYKPWFGNAVLIQGINRDITDSDLLGQYIQKIFPGELVTATIIPDFRAFEKLMKEKESYNEKISLYTKEFEDTGKRPTLSTLDMIRSFSAPGVDAIDFFERKLLDTEIEIKAFCSQPLQGSGTAFVSFQDLEKMNTFLRLRGKVHRHVEQAMMSDDSQFLSDGVILECSNWRISKAVHPSQVMWESVGITSQEKLTHRITYYVVLFLVILFFTTPIAMLGGFNELLSIVTGGQVDKTHGGITSFLPSLLLLALATVIPPVLEASSSMAKHKSKAAQETAAMNWIFVFLFLSTFLLPTFMLTTLAALAVVLASGNNLEELGDLIFPNSAFFVSFVIQAAFLGNGIELLLPGDLLRRIYSSETTGLPDFHYGLSYAYFLTYFSIGIFYSVLVPIMAPATLAFLVIRHIIDKYNLLFRCKKGTEGLVGHQNFFRSLKIIVMVSLMTSTFGIFLYMVTRAGWFFYGATAVWFLAVGPLMWVILPSGGTGEEDEEGEEFEKVEYVHPIAVEYAKQTAEKETF